MARLGIKRYNELEQKMLMFFALKNLYYDIEGTGGYLHTLLEDGNYDSDLSFQIKTCTENNDLIGLQIAQLLHGMPVELQEQLNECEWEIKAKLDFY